MSVSRPRRRLMERFLKQDKGSIILEGVVSIGIVAVLTLGYTSVSTQATVTQRTAVNETIAVQAAQDALEKAKATIWDKVGTDAPSSVALPSGVPAVLGGVVPAAAAPVEIRGLPVTVRAAVGWQKKPSGVSDYGTKLVIVEVSWEDIAGDATTAHTKPQQILITPGIGESVPNGIRGSTETAPTAAPTPTPSPTPTPTPAPSPAPAPVSPFTDVPTTYPQYSDILWIYTANIDTGWVQPDGTRIYQPAAVTSRDRLAGIVYRQLGSPAYTPPATSPYSDLTPASPSYKEITWFQASGISPWTGTTFGSASQITRGEMAGIFYRMAGRPAYTPPATSPFADVAAKDSGYLAMAWVNANGIMGAYTDGTFKPGTGLSRDVMAVQFHNYANKFGSNVPPVATDIDKKYDAVNGPVLLGAPINAEVAGLIRGGKYRCYASGCILWSPAQGATLSMTGPIRSLWGNLGFESGYLGYPTNDGVSGLTNGGSSQTFEGGAIHWSSATGAHATHGAIGSTWMMAGGEAGWLGYPTTDEIYNMRNGGARENFQGGYIYWSPMYGAFYVHGAIGNSWIALGAENSKYGYPKSNEYSWNGLVRQDFEGGYITWSPTGAMNLS